MTALVTGGGHRTLQGGIESFASPCFLWHLLNKGCIDVLRARRLDVQAAAERLDSRRMHVGGDEAAARRGRRRRDFRQSSMQFHYLIQASTVAECVLSAASGWGSGTLL